MLSHTARVSLAVARLHWAMARISDVWRVFRWPTLLETDGASSETPVNGIGFNVGHCSSPETANVCGTV